MTSESKPTDGMNRGVRIVLIVAAVVVTALAWSGVSLSGLLASLRQRF